MDIDEFLDRELNDLGFSTDKSEKAEDNAELPFKKNIEDNSLIDSKSEVRKSNLELTEQAYNQLWKTLISQKLRWNKEVYDQLSVLSRQFSNLLSQSYGEVKRKSGHISELLSRARNALREGKKDTALMMYSEIQEMNNSIPGTFFEDKKVLQDQIIDFYREMMNVIDSGQIAKVSGLMQETSQLVDRINNSIKSNDIGSASADYLKCIEIYNQVPEGFLKNKNLIGIRILDIYKNLSIYSEISALQGHLGQQISIQQAPPSVLMQRPIRNAQRMQRHLQRTRIIKSRLGHIKTQSKQSTSAIQKDAGKTPIQAKSMLIAKKRESAKKNIKKGFYNEAWKDVEEALQIEPNDVESMALRAKIKTLQ